MTLDKEKQAIERLKLASEMSLAIYQQPLVVTFSGGKDSGLILRIAQAAGIPFEVLHNHTTADAPETVRFIRNEFYRLECIGIKCTIEMPKYKGKPTSMWSLIPQKLMPPTRLIRYCCSVLKENGGSNRFVVTGVRCAESVSRKNKRGIYENTAADIKKRVILNNDNDDIRKLFETCKLKAKRVVNPIVDWSDEEVWDYTEVEKIPCNPLYLEFSRVGCIGCPEASKGRLKEFARYPKYKNLYINAFDRMLDERKRKGLDTQYWQNGKDVFHWWVEDGVLPGQIEISDLTDEL